jgi:hypothetical protein
MRLSAKTPNSNADMPIAPDAIVVVQHGSPRRRPDKTHGLLFHFTGTLYKLL